METIKKLGRPRDITKARNRIHSVCLTEKAEKIFLHISSKRPKGWFNKYISKKICDDFPIENYPELLKKQIIKQQEELDYAQAKLNHLVEKYKRAKEHNPI